MKYVFIISLEVQVDAWHGRGECATQVKLNFPFEINMLTGSRETLLYSEIQKAKMGAADMATKRLGQTVTTSAVIIKNVVRCIDNVGLENPSV